MYTGDYFLDSEKSIPGILNYENVWSGPGGGGTGVRGEVGSEIVLGRYF